MATPSPQSTVVRFRDAGRLIADRAARAYTAGSTVADLQTVCAGIHRRGLSTTVCYWNEDADTPHHVAAAYSRLVDLISTFERESYLSIKAPALKFDPFLIDQLVDRCLQNRLCLHFDSLGPEAAEPTFDIIRRVWPTGLPIGISLPARWRRSATDADAAVEMGLRVRIVKGQWGDSESPDINPTEGFLTLVNRLAGRAARVAVATHDAPLAAEALRRLRSAGTPCELEVMHGYPRRRMCEIARQFNASVRVYVPHGRAWLPYRVRSAPANPRVLVWLLRDLLRSRPSN